MLAQHLRASVRVRFQSGEPILTPTLLLLYKKLQTINRLVLLACSLLKHVLILLFQDMSLSRQSLERLNVSVKRW